MQIFHVRGGRVRGQRGWVAEKTEDTDPAGWSSASCCSSTPGSPATACPARSSCRRCPTTPRPWRSGSPTCAAAGSASGCPQRGDKKALQETVARNAKQALAPAQDQARHRPHHPQPGAGGHPEGARAARGAAAHRVLRHLQPAGHRGGRLDGGVRGRPGPQDGVPPLRRPSVDGQNDVAAMHEVITRRFRRLLDERVEHPDLGSERRQPGGRAEARGPAAGRPGHRPAAQVRLRTRASSSSTAARPRWRRPSGRSTSSASTTSRSAGWPSGSRRSGCPARRTRSSCRAPARRSYLLQRVRDEAHRFAITHHRSPAVQDDGREPARRRARARRGAPQGAAEAVRLAAQAPGCHRGGDRRGARHRAADRRGDRGRAGRAARRTAPGERQHRHRRDRGGA